MRPSLDLGRNRGWLAAVAVTGTFAADYWIGFGISTDGGDRIDAELGYSVCALRLYLARPRGVLWARCVSWW